MATPPLVRNVITVEILSNERWSADDLEDLSVVQEAIMGGDSSGVVTITTHNEVVTADRMAELLIAQGSDPSFLLGDDYDDDSDDEQAGTDSTGTGEQPDRD